MISRRKKLIFIQLTLLIFGILIIYLTYANKDSNLDNQISSSESEKNDINAKISDIRELLENNKILLSEKTAQRNALKDNAEIPVNEIEKALENGDIDLHSKIYSRVEILMVCIIE